MTLIWKGSNHSFFAAIYFTLLELLRPSSNFTKTTTLNAESDKYELKCQNANIKTMPYIEQFSMGLFNTIELKREVQIMIQS